MWGLAKKKRVKGDGKRLAIQAAVTLAYNFKLWNFLSGSISQGKAKSVCVPGLNCYSCPGAVGACPMGALQNTVRNGGRISFPYYALGMLILFGAVLGRLICGFLCPFGFVQDLLYKIPFFKKLRSFRGDRALRWVKYAVLLLLCILFPMFLSGDWATVPFFCKYICPSGMLFGAIPLTLANPALASQAGGLFWWKIAVLAVIVLLSLMISRPFCRYLCPLGAFYGLFNRIAIVNLQHAEDKCTHCGACEAVCPMGIDPVKDFASTECIRCTRCARACPHGALHLGIGAQKNSDKKQAAANRRKAGRKNK